MPGGSLTAVATWADVRRIALALPETSVGTSFGNEAWKVRDKTFAWRRPLRRGDLAALGAAASDETPLAVRVADVGVRAALIVDDPAVYFTIPHFEGYAAVLVRLDPVDVDELAEVLAEAWLARAPASLARRHPDVAGSRSGTAPPDAAG